MGKGARKTPMMQASPVRQVIAPGAEVWLKLECLQVTGSFKARGALSKLKSLSAEEIARGLVTASGGNHGVAVAYAGSQAGVPTTVFVPKGVSPAKARKIEYYGARLEVVGEVWDEANRAALALAAKGITYVHPFADPAVMAGQGTIALEILDELPDVDTLIVAIGGGGLIAGMAVAAKAIKPELRIIGVEPTGAPTLHASLAAGHVVTLPRITTKVPTLAASRTEAVNFEIARRHVSEVVLIEDSDMDDACRWLWREMSLSADPSGAAGVAALLTGRIKPKPGSRVATLVCGAGPEGAELGK
ncbi:MAG: threonine/serine dehydratase [Alphaproteobacteria bacterium]|nr:threonine/serine dehydratase [Alphaproteobacteria bacterium]